MATLPGATDSAGCAEDIAAAEYTQVAAVGNGCAAMCLRFACAVVAAVLWAFPEVIECLDASGSSCCSGTGISELLLQTEHICTYI